MKTIKEIIENYSQYEVSNDDTFGARLCQFLNDDEMKQIGFRCVNKFGRPRDIMPWTKANVLEQLKEAVDDGFEDAMQRRNHRALMMFDTVRSWNKVLEDGLENYQKTDYSEFGKPLFKATAEKYGWETPEKETKHYA